LKCLSVHLCLSEFKIKQQGRQGLHKGHKGLMKQIKSLL